MSEQLAAREKAAARHLELGTAAIALIVAVVCWVLYLVLPHAGDVRGYEVTFRLTDAEIKVTEYIYATLVALGVGLGTTLTVMTRRTGIALVSWMLTTVGLAFSLLALWLRQTRPPAEADMTTGVGLYISIIGAAIAVITYSLVVLRRSDEQKAIAQQRLTDTTLDPVAAAQQSASHSRANPMLIDDRRARAHSRNNAKER